MIEELEKNEPEFATKCAETNIACEAKTEESFEADSNESTLVKKAKELKKAIAMCRIGSDKLKLSLLMDTLRNCDAIIDYDKRAGLADPFMKPVNGCLR